jgi:hypothetical protein
MKDPLFATVALCLAIYIAHLAHKSVQLVDKRAETKNAGVLR